ncbi:iron(III) transport system permease protein [Desulfoluna spongiiphila]|uniref:Iron(III) transport system permease protein n=2 Tax=Desulfoluna spongiiphila TaxID=419481 RepID=A0A1G5HJV3_9BACT|nr:iron(III) transport system permease protein [Desulfoluna spongiiphila]
MQGCDADMVMKRPAGPVRIGGRVEPSLVLVCGVALVVLLPILLVMASIFADTRDIWGHLRENLLAGLLFNTAVLSSGVLALTAFFGVSAAYLTALCEFPGRRFFSWALLLPLSVPTYVMAFVYTGLLDFSGPVASFLRQHLPAVAPWMPPVRSTGGVILVLSLALYPYVFLLAAGGFASQGERVLEASRSMGLSRGRLFFRVMLPMARPFILAGLILVLMETLADFGAVAVFNYDTFTTAIYKAWFGFFSIDAASQLASFLVVMALMVLTAEEWSRRRMRYVRGRDGRRAKRIPLSPRQGFGAILFLGGLFSVAFVVPMAQLFAWVAEAWREEFHLGYGGLLLNSLVLAGAGALVTLSAALVLAFAGRKANGRFMAFLSRVSLLGYALPGTVLAVGMVRVLTGMDHLAAGTLAVFGVGLSGPLLQGSVWMMPVAYMVRFLSVGFSAVSSSLGRISPSMDEAARTMGISGFSLVRRIHLPLIRGGMVTGAILVFVDIMKEMPLTLMTRPFGWDTLAVKIFELTSEGEWERAAIPAVALVAAGLIPVGLLVWQKERAKR